MRVTAALMLVVATVASIASAASTSGRANVMTHASSLGKVLVDGKGRTLYLFEKDKNGRSSCSGECASFWPPLLTSGKAAAGAGVKASLLGTTRRSNGTMQVTYAGHPLYRFALDTKAGQTKGEGLKKFGAEWYVVAPSGKKIDKD
jgi:predicted lipoprotein with Yx(FWY)xxD motif